MPSAHHRASVPADHPCLAGHFPGNPVVPAVVLLELVAEAARAALGDVRIVAVRSAKFLVPVLPQQAFEIHLRWRARELAFRCERDGHLLAQGTLEYGPAAA